MNEIDLAGIAAAVGAASDEELERGLEVNRELILAQIFRQMPLALRADRAGDLRVTIEWLVAGRPDGGHDRYRLQIADGSCRLVEPSDAAADVTFEVGALDFLKLVTGNAAGPWLFMTGRLSVRGDLLLAARAPSFFRIPG